MNYDNELMTVNDVGTCLRKGLIIRFLKNDL